MNRAYWTIYDDDSMEFERELENATTVDVDFDRILASVLRKAMAEEGTLDHFEQEKELFEV